jgi:hypothetical protein
MTFFKSVIWTDGSEETFVKHGNESDVCVVPSFLKEIRQIEVRNADRQLIWSWHRDNVLNTLNR